MIQEAVAQIAKGDFMAEIIVGLLAFLGAWLGTKRIKKHLADNYIEARVTKALEVNDKVLSHIRDVLSDLEQTYSENRPITQHELEKVIDQCREISNLAVDGGKEVSTVSYLLYHTIEDLECAYKSETKDSKASAVLDTGNFIGLVDRSLRLMIHQCNTITPIPFRTSLAKRSAIKRSLRVYLSDKKYYSLKHQPFGLTLNPNSEVVLQYSNVVATATTPLFRKRLFMFLQSNLPVVYELIAGGIYMPVVLSQEDDIGFFGNQELHLIKVQRMRSVGQTGGDYYHFYYANISPRLKFVDGYEYEQICERFVLDDFTKTPFSLKDYQNVERRPDETIKVRVSAERAKENFKSLRWKIRMKLLQHRLMQQRFLH